jgi:hypothetical protein
MAESIVKDIYNDIKAELGSITEIGTKVDLYKNQIASLTAFPTVLIDFPYIYYKEASARVQLGNTMVRIILCMDATALTGANVTDIFELKDKVYAQLQGVRKKLTSPDPNNNPKYGPLTRGTERSETKYIDGTTSIYVLEMDFYTTIQDDGVYRLKNFVNANDPLVNDKINLEDDDPNNDHVQLEIVKGNVRVPVPEDESRIGLIIDNLGDDKNNEIRTGKIV